ncbi:hypothetical protein ECDEC6E_2402 [Escherichia coli DEC6E]|nr:hypothetical protein ECDEC6E_2402 [Escherichia coli DEC6E]
MSLYWPGDRYRFCQQLLTFRCNRNSDKNIALAHNLFLIL